MHLVFNSFNQPVSLQQAHLNRLLSLEHTPCSSDVQIQDPHFESYTPCNVFSLEPILAVLASIILNGLMQYREVFTLVEDCWE